MKIMYEDQWGHMEVHVDVPCPYEEDYQLHMLKNNDIGCLLKVTGNGRDGQSRYTFYPGDAVGMEKYYSSQQIKKEDIRKFVEDFMEMVKIVKEHLLNPDHILLTPELIFLSEGKYRFCYLPAKTVPESDSLRVSFHKMTEYFVKKLDYQDTEGVLLVYRLHKETFKEQYELAQIMKDYYTEAAERLEEQKEKGNLPDTAVFCTEKEREDKTRYSPLKKAVRKIKNGRWGRWEDLITEADDWEV